MTGKEWLLNKKALMEGIASAIVCGEKQYFAPVPQEYADEIVDILINVEEVVNIEKTAEGLWIYFR